MITLRLMGPPEEVATLAACVGALVDVLEESPDYPNRGQSGRVRRYLSVRVTDQTLERVAGLLQWEEADGGAA
jgi:hypothetical protein